MAELVAAIGVPHSPHYPSQYPKDGPDRHVADISAPSRRSSTRPSPTPSSSIANDHFNTFFLNNFPTFAIGVAEASSGPNDQTRMPHYDFAVQSELASHVLKAGMNEGFDFAVTQDFGVDHAMLVPLHYLTDGVKMPVVPIWVNAFVKPLPTRAALLRARQHAQGRDRRACRATCGSRCWRPATSRSRSPGPGSIPASAMARPISAGRSTSIAASRTPRSTSFVAEATPEQMWKAGNIGGELLNWIVMLGTVGKAKPCYLADHDDEDGHAFAAWRWN